MNAVIGAVTLVQQDRQAARQLDIVTRAIRERVWSHNRRCAVRQRSCHLGEQDSWISGPVDGNDDEAKCRFGDGADIWCWHISPLCQQVAVRISLHSSAP